MGEASRKRFLTVSEKFQAMKERREKGLPVSGSGEGQEHQEQGRTKKLDMALWIPAIALIAALILLAYFGLRHETSRVAPPDTPKAEMQPQAGENAKKELLERVKQRLHAERSITTETRLKQVITHWLPSSVPTIEENGRRLEVYLEKDDFQSIPYPDQRKLVSSIAIVWCGRSTELFPSVAVRDIRTGKELGHKKCGINW